MKPQPYASLPRAGRRAAVRILVDARDALRLDIDGAQQTQSDRDVAAAMVAAIDSALVELRRVERGADAARTRKLEALAAHAWNCGAPYGGACRCGLRELVPNKAAP